MCAIQYTSHKVAFRFVQFENLFFDGVFCNNSVNHHRLFLTNAVCTVCSLIFDSGIPPGIHMNHIVSGCQIQSCSSRLERNQKCSCIAILKLVHFLLPRSCWRRTVKILISNLLGFHHFANQRQMLDELAEDQNAVPFLTQLQQRLRELRQFCRPLGPCIVNHSRVTSDLTKPS